MKKYIWIGGSLLLLLSCSSKNYMHTKWSLMGKIHQDALNTQKIGIAGPIAGVIGNDFIIGGGSNFPEKMPWLGGAKKYYKTLALYQVSENKLSYNSILNDFPISLAYCANVSTANGIYVIGGENSSGPSQKVFFIKKKENNIQIDTLPDLPIALTNTSATELNGCLYVVGGESVNFVSEEFYVLNLNNIKNGWSKLSNLPHAASHGAFVAAPSGFYFIGGRCKTTNGISNLFSDVYFYSLKDGKWETKASLPYALSASAGAIYNKEYIYLLGGDKGIWFHKTETLIHQIEIEKNPIRKEKWIRDKIALQESHPGFSNEILCYSISENTWKKVDTIPFATPCTTNAVKIGKGIYLPSGEIRAGVRTPDILKFEFITN